MRRMRGTVACLMIVGLALSAQGGLLAYEGFFGALGNGAPLHGMSAASTGLTGSWSTAGSPVANDRVTTIDRNWGSALFFPANVPFAPTQKPGNNYQWWEFRSGGGGPSIWDRRPATRGMTSTVDFSANGEYYLSFLGRTHGGSDSYLTVGVRDSGTNESTNVGWHWNNSGPERYMINNNTNADGFTGNVTMTTPPHGLTENQVYFFVAQIRTSAAANDVISLKAYDVNSELVHAAPNLLAGVGTGPDQWDVSMSINSNAAADLLQLATNGAGYPNADEIRLGTTWEDVTGLTYAAPRSNAIGFNFVGGQGGGVLAPDEVAGAPYLPQANWNNLATDWHGNGGAVPSQIVDDVRNVVGTNNDSLLGMRVQYDSNTTWGTGIGSATPDERLMRGYLDDHSGTTSQPYVDLLNIPYGYYDLVLYVDGDQTNGVDGPYWLEDENGTPITPDVYVGDVGHFNGSYNGVPTDSTIGSLVDGNYIVFTQLTSPDLTIRAFRDFSLGTRAPINAFQLVQRLPEPTSLALLGLGLAAVARRRRRA